MLRLNEVGAIVLTNVCKESVPVVEAEELREDVERAVARGVGAVDVAPQPFQRSRAHGLVCALPDGTAQEDEVGWRFHFALQIVLDAFAKFEYFRTCLVHNVLLNCKNANFYRKTKVLFNPFFEKVENKL